MTEIPDHNHENNDSVFEISQEELRSLHDSFADALVRKGKPTRLSGLYPVLDERVPDPTTFTYPLPTKMVRELFFRGDDSVNMHNDSMASYTMPHRIDLEGPETDVYTGASVTVNFGLNDTDVDGTMFVFFGSQNDRFECAVKVEYSRDGIMISPNDYQQGSSAPLTDERVFELLDDEEARTRPMTLDDVARVREIIGFIQDAPVEN